MSRLSRSTVAGYPHQVTQRGNYGQTVFEGEPDFRQYLAWTREYADRYAIDIWAYCLMPNHVHFVCVPRADAGLALCFNTLNMRYAQYFHRRKGVTGHLWMGRFLSCLLDESSVREEVRFIENNPVRWGLAEKAEDYPWSSASGRVSGEQDPVLAESAFPSMPGTEWKNFLRAEADEAILGRTRARLKTGRPAGDPEFVRKIEGLLGRALEARPRGRPRKCAQPPGKGG